MKRLILANKDNDDMRGFVDTPIDFDAYFSEGAIEVTVHEFERIMERFKQNAKKENAQKHK